MSISYSGLRTHCLSTRLTHEHLESQNTDSPQEQTYLDLVESLIIALILLIYRQFQTKTDRQLSLSQSTLDYH